MAKAPLIRDTLLAGQIAAVLVGSPESVHATIYGTKVTADQLRILAAELDKMESATNAFFGSEEIEFDITYRVNGAEDSQIIKSDSSFNAVEKFYAKSFLGAVIASVTDRSTGQACNFHQRTPRNYE